MYTHALAPPPLHAHCDCGVRLIPGLTLSCKIRYTRSKRRYRFFVVTCLVCSRLQKHSGLLNESRRVEKPVLLLRKPKKKELSLFSFMS